MTLLRLTDWLIHDRVLGFHSVAVPDTDPLGHVFPVVLERWADFAAGTQPWEDNIIFLMAKIRIAVITIHIRHC